ncbi:MAG: hypothetical protein JSV05_09065 [Candidatus Bathyarchaeota archaeon]|nr:MAG: hypothetical protein JSV05_09065 [Candidatus Bathyarchaeota archaeon]
MERSSEKNWFIQLQLGEKRTHSVLGIPNQPIIAILKKKNNETSEYALERTFQPCGISVIISVSDLLLVRKEWKQ